MRNAFGMTMLGCLLFATMARASDGEVIALDNLPQAVTDHIKSAFTRAELLHARKEVDGRKECYVVRIMHNGRIIDLYASPDGVAITTKEDSSFTKVPEHLPDYFLFLVLPGAIAGAFVRWLNQAVRSNKFSVLSEWFSAWCGAGIIIGIILSAVSTVPREKDFVVIAAHCVVWGAISASLVEILGLTLQSIRGYRAGCRRWILGFCLVTFVCLCLAIPVDLLRIERENQYFRALAMRPLAH